MMASHYYAFLSRMKNIYRWGLMRNTRRESLSEHSFEVALIAHALAVLNNTRLHGTADPEKCATAALFHDTTEILTGDMPTPVKYANPAIREAYKAVESVAEQRLLGLLPSDLQPYFDPLYHPDETTHSLVKAADRLSALIKCLEEESMGNREFTAAKESILASIHESGCKEAELFLDEFIQSYSLTLDEQEN